jgi:hypothetical protein
MGEWVPRRLRFLIAGEPTPPNLTQSINARP